MAEPTGQGTLHHLGSLTTMRLKHGSYSLAGAAGSGVLNNTPITVSYLVIAGGGSGGAHQAGGGGAGGYRNSYASETSGANSATRTPLSLLTGASYLVTVGAGGPSVGVSEAPGVSGNPSVFSSVTTVGGGGGERYINPHVNFNPGQNGGSGGGGSSSQAPSSVGALSLGTPLEGHGGGGGWLGCCLFGGGAGGGAGGAGGNGTGAGDRSVAGIGLASLITGSSITRGVGGRGGIYPTEVTGPNGTDNYGNGGQGTGTGGYASGGGGKGVVILRWLTTQGTILLGAGLFSAAGVLTSGGDSYVEITTGTGNVSWS